MYKKLKNFKHRFFNYLRFIGFIIVNIFWPIISLPLCRAAALSGRPFFGLIFLVYPGTVREIKSCVPLWYRKFKPGAGVIGIMRKGKKGKRGLVMAIPWTIDEMEKMGNLEKSVDKVSQLAKSIGVKSIALGGRIVTVLFKRGYKFEPPMVLGSKGAVFVVSNCVKQALELMGPDIGIIEIGILGHGFLGSRLTDFLEENSKHNIIAVDPRFTHSQKQGRVKLTPDFNEITNCEILIVLTPKGIQIEDEIKYFKKGISVIDDTHPALPRKLVTDIKTMGNRVIKAVAILEGVEFWPKLPKWNNDWIPGCCVEALITAIIGDLQDKSQEEFNNIANNIGFKTPSLKK